MVRNVFRWNRLLRKSRFGVAVLAACAIVGLLGAASLPTLFSSQDLQRRSMRLSSFITTGSR